MKAKRKALAGATALGAIGLAAVGLLVASSAGSAPSTRQSLHASAFSWLRPSMLPAGWSEQELPASTARLPLPSGWRATHGDAGTRTALLKGPSGRIAGYLNATPQQGRESLENWSEFRVDHNRDEGEREVRLLAAATNLRFRGGTGSCVIDSYRTTSGSRYRELACIVSGRTTTVVVGAAPPPLWSTQGPAIEGAIKSFTT